MNKIMIAVGLLLAGVASRFFNLPPNFSAILSIALFGGAVIQNRLYAYLLPLGVMLISDFILGWHESLFAVYACLALNVYLGGKINRSKAVSIAGYSVLASVIFFIATNFSVWALTDYYAHDMNGLTAAYVSAIPFYKNTLISALLFSFVFFYSYNFLTGLYEKKAVQNTQKVSI